MLKGVAEAWKEDDEAGSKEGMLVQIGVAQVDASTQRSLCAGVG